MSSQYIFREVLKQPVNWLNISSQFPNVIIEKIEECKSLGKNLHVVLENIDVWRYGTDRDLIEYLSNDPRTFYILTLGYKNRKILGNVYEISWPGFYFARPKNNIFHPKVDDRSYGFSCLNNKSSFHRLVLGLALWKNNLIKDMIFTQNLIDLPCGYYDVLMNEMAGMHDYLSVLPLTWTGEQRRNFAGTDTIDHVAYTNAWCNIVTESEMQEFVFEGPIIDLPTITEKSYKPFRSRQIPIWLAAPGHCEYLKSLGFETMEDFLPARYDDMGLFEKVDAIIQTVAKGKDYAEAFYHAHIREIEHNYELIQSTRVESVIIDTIKNFLAKQ